MTVYIHDDAHPYTLDFITGHQLEICRRPTDQRVVTATLSSPTVRKGAQTLFFNRDRLTRLKSRLAVTILQFALTATLSRNNCRDTIFPFS